MLARVAIFALLPIAAVAAFLVAFFVFYRGGYDAPPSPDLAFEQITTSSAPSRITQELPPGPERSGLLVVDAQHANAFSENEVVSFTSQVADRGFEVEFVGDFLPIEDPSQLQPRYFQLADKLRQADSFAVILPRVPYSEAEAALVERFVRRGGKLLLVSDPGRPQNIDGLAKRFGVDFQADYLYNTVDNDTNFKRIFIRDFQPDQITAGLKTITLEYASSVQSSGGGVAFASPNTRSSVLETVGAFPIVAWGDSRNVLAIADFTFMVPSNDSLLDNGKLVSNIADYVTDSQREFLLSDFPYFFGNAEETVDILLGQPDLLSVGLQMKTGLAGRGAPSEMAPLEDLSRDSVFLGLYDDASQVDQYLQTAGVRVDDTLGTPFVSELALESTAVYLLDQGQDRDLLVILADTPKTLASAVGRMLSGEYRGNLLSDFVGVYKFVGADQ